MFVVKRQMGEDSPVFELEAENGKGRTRVLHRNMLFPCDFLPLRSDENMTSTCTKTIKTRQPAETNTCETHTTNGK